MGLSRVVGKLNFARFPEQVPKTPLWETLGTASNKTSINAGLIKEQREFGKLSGR